MRTEIRCFPLLIAAALPCAAQNPGLAGEVTNSLTGAPVARAHVTLMTKERRYGVLADDRGKFSFENLIPDSYQISATRIGFRALADFENNGPIALQAGKQHDPVRLELTPLGAVLGRVLDPDGEPVEGMVVIASKGRGGGRSARTDEKGQFRIGGLVPGKYRVVAEKEDEPLPQEIRTDGTTEVRYAATWYPGALAAKSATQVEVQPGAETGGVEIRLLSVPILGVRGKIKGIPAGAKGWELQIVPGQRDAEIAADGSFEIWRLDPGHYRLWAYNRAPDGKELRTAPEEIDVGSSNVENVRLTVAPLLTLNGRLEFDDDQTRQKLHRLQPLPKIILNDTGEDTGSHEAEIGEGDTFTLQGLPASRYQVSLGQGPTGTVYVKSIRLGQTETDGAALDLRHGSAGADLSLTVSSAMGSLAGTVHDDKGAAAKAWVALAAGEDGREEEPGSFGFTFVTERTTPDGTYGLDNLVPGKYKLVALENRSGIDPSDFLEDGEEVEIRAGEKILKDLTRQSAGGK